MKRSDELMLDMIKSAVFHEAPRAEIEADGQLLESIFSLSKKHDIAQIVALGLEKQRINTKSFSKEKLLAIFRRENQNYELSRISSLFEEEKIFNIPLKGSVTKELYPEDWMRTGADIDILIKDSDLERGIKAVTEKLGFEFHSKSRHDCSLISKSGVNLELHFAIKSSFADLDKVFGEIWDNTIPKDGKNYELSLTNEYLQFYNIAHMKYHFSSGGCGVKPFIDLKLMEDKLQYSEADFLALIEKAGCMDFYKGVKKLSSVWFGNESHNDLSKAMEEFILSGGVFGTRENYGAADRYLKGSKFKYYMSRIFATRERLRIMYPICEKYPILMPFYQVKRWFRLFDKKVSAGAKNELKGEGKAQVGEMMKELGF